jgi:phytoene dehydrogenase-like protein
MTTDFDVIVIGSGPNGLSAAINLQIKGLSVLLIESKSTLGRFTNGRINFARLQT